jgi:hypothetical protein
MHPFNQEFHAPGRYTIRRGTGLDVRLIVGGFLLAGMSAFVLNAALTETKTSEVVASVLLLLVFGPLMLFTLFRALRAPFGRVVVEVGRDDIRVTETFSLTRSGRRIPRTSVDGVWVAGGVDEGGAPVPFYALMFDCEGSAKVCIIADLSSLDQAVALAEDLATRVGVPADTRGSDFR